MDESDEKVFSYENLKAKAKREIRRLKEAEKCDGTSPIDHALNAAFSIYHLIEWKYNITAHKYIVGKNGNQSVSNNDGLKILHDIVTYHKHAAVSKKGDPNLNHDNTHSNNKALALDDGTILALSDDSVLRLSGCEVKFDEHIATDVLTEALEDFEKE